jgi:Rrf2 family protein
MQITRASDYAVRVMIYLAGLPPNSTIRQAELSRETGVSSHFLSKVLQQLVRSGLIRSHRGSSGGYALALSAQRVSLLDVVQAMEGPVQLNQCVADGLSCDRKAWCPAHQVWIEAQASIVNILGRTSMANLAAGGKGSPATTYVPRNDSACIAGARAKSKQRGMYAIRTL